MLKKIMIPISILLSFWLYYACHDDLDTPKDQSNGNFSESMARNHFETNAEYLNPLHFGHKEHPETRRGELSLLNLVPQWNKAARSVSDIAEVVEIPVGSNSDLIASRKVYHRDSLRRMEIVRGERKLIIARRHTGQVQMFLITLIPDRECVRKGDASAAEFRYLGGSRFSGLVICSELDGRYGDIFRYKDGHQTQRLGIVHAGEEYRNAEGKEYFRLKLEESVHLRTRTGSAEYPGEHNCTGPNCIVCNTQELEEVVVTPDPCYRCNQLYCVCCKWCFDYPCVCNRACQICYHDPCTCSEWCPTCLRPETICICVVCPVCYSRYCLGHSGGGGGNNGSGNTVAQPEARTDCSPQSTINGLHTNAILNIDDSRFLQPKDYTDSLRNYAVNKPVEYSFAIQYAEDNYYVWHQDGISLYTSNNQTLTIVPVTANTFLVAHTHPAGTVSAPSPLDAIFLARSYIVDKATNIQGNVIFAHDGSEYAIYVNDRTAFANFCNSAGIQDFLDENGSAFKAGSNYETDYNAVYSHLIVNKYSENDARSYALSYVLEKYNTGLTINSRQNRFQQFREQKTYQQGTTNNPIYKPKICP